MPQSYWFGRGTERYMVAMPQWMAEALAEIKRTTPGLNSISHVVLEIVVEELMRLGYKPPMTDGYRPMRDLVGGGHATRTLPLEEPRTTTKAPKHEGARRTRKTG